MVRGNEPKLLLHLIAIRETERDFSVLEAGFFAKLACEGPDLSHSLASYFKLLLFVALYVCTE